MEIHNHQKEEDKDRSSSKKNLQNQKSASGFVDNRPETVAQRKLQELADNSPQVNQMNDYHAIANNSPQVKQLKAFQEMADNSPQSKQAAQLQATADKHVAQQLQQIQKKENNTDATSGPIQRMVNVSLITDEDDKKSIEADGTVKEFKNGTTAGTKGWIGVKKYRARYQIDSKDGKYRDKGEVGPLQNSFTNPEAGHVLGKQNGGNGGDPANIFAQDGGTNNGTYKSFEIDMRSRLNQYKDNDKVFFKSYLVGDDIEEGTITGAGLSDASDISSDEEMSE